MLGSVNMCKLFVYIIFTHIFVRNYTRHVLIKETRLGSFISFFTAGYLFLGFYENILHVFYFCVIKIISLQEDFVSFRLHGFYSVCHRLRDYPKVLEQGSKA